MAKEPCESKGDACMPTPTTLGDELCGGGKCHGVCNAAAQKILNIEGGWLRSDVQQSAKECLAHDKCSDVTACLDAWYHAVVL